MKIMNAKTLPQIYYGLHFAEGVAEYKEPGKEAYRILINESTIKKMDPTFAGKPVYVRHVDEVNLDKLQAEADGYVVESFFNKNDGKHWAKFIVVSDKGHEAISAGFRLSNAYIPTQFAGGGRWHNVDFSKEVVGGEYEHLALVHNPRYEESIILTPEQFKAYNSEKELELKRLANSKETPSMFNFFTKKKLENAAEIEGAVVTLKSGKEVSIQQLINDAEAYEADKEDKEKKNAEPPKKEEAKKEEPKKEEAPMANGEHKVKVGEEEMTVNELVEKHMALKDAKKNEEPSDEEKKKMEAEEAAKKKNEEDEKAKKEAESKKQNSHFDSIYNAGPGFKKTEAVFELDADKVKRGQDLYGSGK